jgi:hypothetical protein
MSCTQPQTQPQKLKQKHLISMDLSMDLGLKRRRVLTAMHGFNFSIIDFSSMKFTVQYIYTHRSINAPQASLSIFSLWYALARDSSACVLLWIGIWVQSTSRSHVQLE